MSIELILNNRLSAIDGYIFGLADMKGLINKKFEGYRYGISIAKKLDDKIIDSIYNGPTLAYYKYYTLINQELKKVSEEIRDDLNKINIDSVVIEPTLTINKDTNKEYLQTLTVDLSHKMVATRSGLGWIGKTDLFISKKYGPRVRLASILINKRPEKLPEPIKKSRCGDCTICVVKCPAQAANGVLWNTQIHRDSFFNARKCREKCGQLSIQKLGIDKRICGICISVCPVGIRI